LGISDLLGSRAAVSTDDLRAPAREILQERSTAPAKSHDQSIRIAEARTVSGVAVSVATGSNQTRFSQYQSRDSPPLGPFRSPQGPDVMVFIGHTKEHIDDRGLEKLLQALSRESDIKIISLDTLARTLSANQVSLAAQ
jgi:hypothetical protein